MFDRVRSYFKREAPKAPSGRRVYVIGDIHGRLDLLEQMFHLIAQDQEQRTPVMPDVVLIGDLIDRGPDSRGVVELAMNPPSWLRLTVLMGNHEWLMVEALGGSTKAISSWLKTGGDAALLSWGLDKDFLSTASADEIGRAAYAVVPAEQRRWLNQLPPSLRCGDYFCVHAGVRPGRPLDQQPLSDSLWIRDVFLNSDRDHGAIVIHGHSISDQVDQRSNRIGIDTGAYATGRLTAVALEADERWFLSTK